MTQLTHKQAKAQGAVRYFTGKPCPQGHVAERYVSTRACTACAAENKRQWASENPEKVRVQKRVWRNANLEHARKLNRDNQKKHRAKANERNRRYAVANPDAVRASAAAWAKANPGKVLARAARRRAAKRHAVPSWADSGRIGRTYQCAAALRSRGLDVEVDHVVPLQGEVVCGLHVPENLQIISTKANRAKANRSI